MKSRIVVGVGGRFHADHLTSALLAEGHSVDLVTSLPRSRFPNALAPHIHSYIGGELVYRLGRKLGFETRANAFKLTQFGGALAGYVRQAPPDTLICWSSFALEAFQALPTSRRILIRDSTHIQDQFDVLAQEYQRFQLPFSVEEVARDRELKEYELAHEIIVLSEVAKQSFVSHGIPDSKLRILRLGVDTSRFRPATSLGNLSPYLKVVYFGSLSVRKGVPYLVDAIRQLADRPCEFHLIGHVEKGLAPLLVDLPQTVIHGALPQAELAEFIREMDLFVFPTLEDGFGQTLIQAMAAGVVPIVSDRCGATDLVQDGRNAVVIPARQSAAIVEAVLQFVENPEKIVTMREEGIRRAQEITWDFYRQQVAKIFPAPDSRAKGAHTPNEHHRPPEHPPLNP